MKTKILRSSIAFLLMAIIVCFISAYKKPVFEINTTEDKAGGKFEKDVAGKDLEIIRTICWNLM